jgi:uncharacterized protein (TIGR03000 family)
MYSVVLATMVTVGGEAPNWGNRCHGWSGCHGCSGWSGCYGCGGCYGCFGGGGYAFGVSFGCSGCHCSGWGWGAGWGCAGCYCSGSWCSGCSGWYACSGCWGGGVVVSGWGCSCSGASCSGCSGPVVAQRPPDGGLIPRSEEERKAVREALKKVRDKGKSPGDKEEQIRVAPGAAVVTVSLPADARLFIDDVACPLTTAKRSFQTPALEAGREYFYTLRAEIVRNGETRTQSQRITFGAGRQVNVEFTNFAATQTASR